MDAHDRWQESVAEYAVPHQRLRQIASLATSLGPTTVADIGCATGALRRLLPADVRYVGVDFVAATEPDFEFHRCDLNREPLPTAVGEADVVVCSGIAEYVVDLPAFLASLRGTCRPGAHLVFSYFNMNHLSRAVDLVRGRTLPHHPDWSGLHSPRSIERMLTRAGYDLLERRTTSHGLRRSRGVGATVGGADRPPAARPWSRWLAHQFIYLLRAP